MKNPVIKNAENEHKLHRFVGKRKRNERRNEGREGGTKRERAYGKHQVDRIGLVGGVLHNT